MRRRFIASLVGVLGISLLLAPATAVPAQAAAGKAVFTVAPPTTVYNNQDVSFTVDFPTGSYDEGTWGNYPYLAIFKSTDDGATFSQVAPGAKSNSSGVLAMTYNVGTAKSKIKVCNDIALKNGQAGKLYNDGISQICTDGVSFDPQTPPPSGAALTVAPDGKTAQATFTGAAMKSGQSASLQIATIVTAMTNEVTATSWKTIATANQNSSGVANFSVSNPYEVSHKYRAITGTSPQYISNEVTLAASLTAKSTGVPQVYFNSNEQASVNTRTRYFEGRFTFVQAGSNVQFGECDKVLDKDGKVVDTVAKPTLAALKGRGNYSWSFSKKSFTLKLDSKRNFCGMGASKKWALVANHYDKSLLRNTVADYIGSKLTHLAFTPDSRPVDFWMNGVYQGSYILIERIAGDTAAKRLPYDALNDNHYEKDGVTPLDPKNTPGFLLEWDFRKGADHNITVGSRGYAGIKDPENDYNTDGSNAGTGITQAQIDYINGYVDACDAKLFGSSFTNATTGWRSCIDEDSAIDYYIGMELMKPVDGNMWASVYMWKPANGKLQMGPLWDFDLAAGSANRAGGTVNSSGWYLRNVITTSAKQSTKTWFNRLNEDGDFRKAVAKRWDDVIYPALTDSTTGVDSYMFGKSNSGSAGFAKKISASASENFKKWSVTEHLSSVQVVKGSWGSEVTYLRGWLNSRISWMNSNL